MEVLPLVSFVLGATGLSAFALGGLMALDWYAGRRAQRSPRPAPRMVCSQPAGTAKPVPRQTELPLRKAA